MPIVLLWKNFKVRIHYGDHLPKHVHVEQGNKERECKIRIGGDWEVLTNRGFSKRDIRRILTHLRNHESFLLREWEKIIND